MTDNLEHELIDLTVEDPEEIPSDVATDILRMLVTVEMVPEFVKLRLARLLGGEKVLSKYKVSTAVRPSKGSPNETSEESRTRTPLHKEKIRQIIDCVQKHFPGDIKEDEILEIIRVTLNNAAAQQTKKREEKNEKANREGVCFDYWATIASIGVAAFLFLGAF